jgi:SCP-2 sterol transfer family
VFVPPGWDTSYVECFGFTLEQIYEEGARSFEAKFKAAGLPIDSLPGPQAMPMDLPARGRAERGLAMLRAGYLGEPNGRPPARDPDAMEILFDSIRRGVDLRRAPDGPLVVQWEFADAEPWHLRLANGSSAAVPGRAPHVDVELRCRFDDWVDVVAGRLDPRRAVATGRLRPRGTPRALWRARGLLSAS